MTILLLILGVTDVILLFLLIMQKREMRHIARQLQEIKNQNTNFLLHSLTGMKDSQPLINEINAFLKETRQIQVDYRIKSHDLEQMLTNISHDLRTPLTSALGYIGILQQKAPGQEEKRELEIVEKRLLRLEELIDSFFEFSKIISKGEPPATSALNLVSVLEEAMIHYYDDYCAARREIIFQCQQHKLTVHSNQNMLLRIFDNLIGNALKHGTGNLTISVETDSAVKICFSNQLSNADMDTGRVFDEFYTTDISRTKGNTGLGLAIAKQFTHMLGGSIRADYDGETFRVTVEFHPD